MSFIKSQKTGRRIAVNGEVWTLAYELWLWMGVWLVPFRFLPLNWVLSLNSLASKYLYKFSTWGSLLGPSEGTPGFGIRTMYFFNLICRTLEVGCQWTPWRQHNLGDPLARHDWFGKRYYCATSRRWPGGSTSESGKDPVTRSRITMMEYRALTKGVNLQRLERWRATVRKRRVVQFCCVECEVSNPSCNCTM